jgi:hypothetical protein
MNEPKASVREISHEVRVDLTDAAPMKTATGRRRKPVGLRIRYGLTRGVTRVDVTVEFHDAAETFPPVLEMPEWMSRIVEANRPADVDNPDDDRRTGMGGWPLPAPEVPTSAQLAAAMSTVYRSMWSCVGDEWAMEWLGEVWSALPLTVRAAAGDTDAADELTTATDARP